MREENDDGKYKGSIIAQAENKMHWRENFNVKGENEGLREIRKGTKR